MTEILPAAAPRVRRFGAVNWIGFWTLYEREVRRFLKVFTQTVAAPVVTTLLFLTIFVLALGGGGARQLGGVPYLDFLLPGLVMMAVMQNAFANTSSSLMLAKVQGSITDLLMPPLSALELTLGIALGGVTRGVVVGLAVALALVPLVPMHPVSVLAILFYGFSASLLMSLLGVLAGLWAEKFDHIAAATNFIVMPLTFLSGTFYSVAQLPPPWRAIAHVNPFFQLIDGFRYGFTGASEGSILVGAGSVTAINLILLAWCHRLFVRGYKLKA
ncbi:MAG TPA: ABC transporter permease [Stellaceae bacterium]|nr:ABC transporter permease [Stellaceae bacterium]